MALPNIYNPSRGSASARPASTKTSSLGGRRSRDGFTLIEVLIVMGLFTILFTIGLFLTMDSYRAYSFRSEREILVSLLDRARSQALANVDMTPHGVCFDEGFYILFAGRNCIDAGAGERIPGSPGVVLEGLSKDTPVIFEQVSAEVLLGGAEKREIVIKEHGRESNISITHEGKIDW